MILHFTLFIKIKRKKKEEIGLKLKGPMYKGVLGNLYFFREAFFFKVVKENK